jgi:hypothetical protein
MASISLDFRTNNGIVIEGLGIATSSTNATNGLQIASGGAAIGKNLIVGSTATIWGNSTLYGTLDVGGITNIINNTAATSGGAGSLKIAGGTYIGNNLYIAGTQTSSVNTNSNSFYTAGGLGVARDGSFGGNVVVTGNFTVLGTQTIINSTSTSIQDPVLDIGTGPNNEPLLGNDGYNKGIVIHYYDIADNHMFLGRNNLSGNMVLRNNIDAGQHGNIPNADYANSGTYANLDLLNLYAHGTENSFNATTGAIQVSGGIGTVGSVYVGSTLTAATIVAQNLVSNRLVVSTNGKLVDYATLSWNTTANRIEGTITYANTASNVFGGVSGNLLYQTGTNQTGVVSNGNYGEVLLFDGQKPYWGVPSAITAGNANTATNLGGGFEGAIPFQTAPGITNFSHSFTWTNATSTLNVSNVAVTATTSATSTTTGALTVAGGASVEKDLYVGGNLNIGGQLFFGGVGADQISSTTATFVNVVVTGTGVALTVTNSVFVGDTLTTNNLIVKNNTSLLGGTTATTFTATQLTISGSSVLQNLTATIFTATNANVRVALNVTGQTTLAGLTASDSTLTTLHITSLATLGTLTSAVVVDGGASIAKDLYVGGTSNLQNTIATTLTASSIIVTGNEVINGNLIVDNTATIKDLIVTNITSLSTLTAVTATINDLSVLGSITIGGSQFSAGGGFVSTGTSAFGNITANLGTFTNLTVTNNETIGNNLLVGNLFTATTATVVGQISARNISISTTATFAGVVNITDISNAVATNVASFVTAGGVGIAKDIVVGGAINVGSISTATVVPALYTNNVLLASYTSPTINGSSTRNLDTYSAITYRTAKYFIQIVDGSSIHVTEVTLFHDGSNVYKNEYAIATNYGELGTFDATLNTGVITLNFTPYSATIMEIKVVRLGLTA